MLEFIVLGLIPGTSVQITFLQVLIAAAILVLSSEAVIRAHRRGMHRAVQQLINQLQS